jgi:hypothetical protein
MSSSATASWPSSSSRSTNEAAAEVAGARAGGALEALDAAREALGEQEPPASARPARCAATRMRRARAPDVGLDVDSGGETMTA